ncbi:DUF6519 domain-containing protein [Ferribacterium limneticum]|uniref:DUF6519 domain-containing protein n=1 Tax=Ferribacterium limneticum TaxID=76259 RepID=UPI001CF93718|nr:DUF6519 domain-containing protein [Ferribacterium limneticum]UCV17582.1 hypothetical protein KI610_12170 [Ferribacterium limneticum]
MKADLSRATFDKARRYRSVRMQQGRVQLDADFNEQQDILNHRIEIETRDSLGPVAVPIDNPGFGLTPAGTDLSISAGRLYVDGLLCENPAATTVANQPDLPDTASPVLPAGASLLPLPPVGVTAASITGVVVFNAGNAVAPADGTYLAYLEAWQRHLSPLDLPVGDTSMREVALGGPDTCTREKTVWQVKLLRAGDLGAPLTCLSSNIAAWNTLTAAPDGRLAARAEASIPPKTPCQLPPEAGYRLLENHLYRVEIHDDASVTGKASYKWSRDNGSLASRVVRWLNDPIANEFEVASIGRDDVLAITAGCWVEFYDDTHELLGQPGPLVPVIRTEGNVVTVDLTKLIGHALDQAMFPSNPRVRRWDGVAEISTSAINSATGWEELAQDGIELKFAPGSYRIGDYWLIPARTATAAIEWPLENNKPAFLSPAGVLRAFAKLALLEFKAGAWILKSDCRPLFPSLTELTQLHYVGGDGQSIKTNPANSPAQVALPSPLQVGVANGQFPVVGARVRFTASDGLLPNGTKIQEVDTLADGVASIAWSLDSDPTKPVQHVTAELLVAGQVVAGRYLPVHFSAQLALASGVAYDPSDCADLLAAEAYTVQLAIDTLCKRTSGGGCCVTVGLAGEYENLDVALRALINEGRRDICICLLPGNHSLADGLSLTGTPRHHISIHGAGPASRLILKQEVFKFDTFGSLSLKDFTLANSGEPSSFSFLKCQDVDFSNVDFLGRSATGSSLLQIAGSSRLLIEDCTIFAIAPDNNEKLDFIAQRVPSLAPHRNAFRATATLDGNLNEAAEAIAALSAADRKKMVAEISTFLRSNDLVNLSSREQTSLNNLSVVVGRNSTAAALNKALDQLANALRAGTPAFALALDDTDDASLINNRVRGRITLFGESDEFPDVTDNQLKRLSAALKAGAVTFDDSGSLVLERNALQAVRMSGKALSKVIDTAQGTLPVWHNLQVTNNRIDSEEDLYPGFNCAFNGNTLEPQGDVGALLANQAKVIGNFAHNDFRLFVTGTNPENFGNGGLNVVPI